MSDGEIDDIKAAKEKLMTDAQALFAKLYEQSNPQGAGPDMSGAGNSDTTQTYGDDVVDGDYKEV
jgi:molecular chaperone DnaK